MPEPACTYALLEIDDSTARLEVFGRDPLTLDFPFAPSGARPWPTPRARVTQA